MQIHGVEPLVEFSANLAQVRNFLKPELLVQPEAGGLVRGDVRKDGTKSLSPGGVNQFLPILLDRRAKEGMLQADDAA